MPGKSESRISKPGSETLTLCLDIKTILVAFSLIRGTFLLTSQSK